MYAANTASAIGGALAAGFVLIPLAGTQGSVELLAWSNIAKGPALVMAVPERGQGPEFECSPSPRLQLARSKRPSPTICSCAFSAGSSQRGSSSTIVRMSPAR